MAKEEREGEEEGGDQEALVVVDYLTFYVVLAFTVFWVAFVVVLILLNQG